MRSTFAAYPSSVSPERCEQIELKEFVTEALVQIQEGVQDAIDRRRDKNAAGVINPVFGSEASSSHLQNVEFDVAITATDKREGPPREVLGYSALN